MKQSAVMHPTQKYAWVCSFQETPSEPITSNCDQFIFDLGEERDQLREQVKMLRDVVGHVAGMRFSIVTTKMCEAALAATEPKE